MPNHPTADRFAGDERVAALFFIALLMVYIGVMGFFFPLQGDDFFFAHQYRDGGIFVWLKYAYFNWTLRLGEVFNILQFSVGKTLFNILDPFIQLALALTVFAFAFGRPVNFKESVDCTALAIFFALSAVLLARPRDTVFWMTGANVYAFGSALWFGFWSAVMRAQRLSEEHSTTMCALFFLWGAAAALTIENCAPCGIFVGVWLIVCARRHNQSLRGRVKSALGGYALGLLVFVSQPGRWQRLHVVDTVRESIVGLWFEVGLFHIVSAFFALILLFASGFLLWHFDREKFKKEIRISAAPILLSLISSGCFAAFGITPAMRAYLFSSLLAAVAGVRFLVLLRECGHGGRIFYRIICGVLLLAAVLQISLALPDFIRISRDRKGRDEIIRRSSPEENVVVPGHSVVRRKFFQYVWIEDITADPENPFNVICAKYCNVRSIRTLKNAETPLYWKKR